MVHHRFSPLVRQALFEEKLPKTNPSVGIVKAARIRFEAGQPTGIHRHQMSTCGVVTEGSFHYQMEGDATRTLYVGDAFFEPAGRTIEKFDNASDSQPAEIVCFYLTDSTERQSIDMLDGGISQQQGE